MWQKWCDTEVTNNATPTESQLSWSWQLRWWWRTKLFELMLLLVQSRFCFFDYYRNCFGPRMRMTVIHTSGWYSFNNARKELKRKSSKEAYESICFYNLFSLWFDLIRFSIRPGEYKLPKKAWKLAFHDCNHHRLPTHTHTHTHTHIYISWLHLHIFLSILYT